VDIVLPLLATGLDRYVRLQRPTVERFYRDLGTTWIYARPEDLESIRRATAGMDGVRVRSDLDLVPELRLARRVKRDVTRGWYQQQLVKLAAVAEIDTEFALVMDADVIAVADVSDGDMLPRGRGIHHKEPVAAHPKWVSTSAAALGMAPLDYCVSATPSVLARGAVLELASHARDHVRPRKRAARLASVTPGLRGPLTTWRGRLLAALPWTEYQLYETFLVRTGRFDEYHCHSDDPVLWENSVWSPGEFDAWVPGRDDGPRHWFSVVQGSLRIPVDAIEAKMRAAGLLPA
jgi:hypothetical protein